MNATDRPLTAGDEVQSQRTAEGDAPVSPEIVGLAQQFKQALVARAPRKFGTDGDGAEGDAEEMLAQGALGAGQAATVSATGLPALQAGAVAVSAKPTPSGYASQAGKDADEPNGNSQVPTGLAGDALPDWLQRTAEVQRDTNAATGLGEPEADTLGAAMLQSWLNQSSPAPVQSPPQAPPVAPVQSLESVIADTVSRVLVTDPLHDDRREVRIDLAKDVLPDTQVRLWREEGRLHVEFVSSTAVADNGLRDALPNLSAAIQKRQPETELPVVMLRVQAGGADGQANDGRSRQQYVCPDTLEELA